MPVGALDATTAVADELLARRIDALCEAGWDVWDEFTARVSDHQFHPFVAADYQVVRTALWPLRGHRVRFLEWGSATGVITVLADLLGFDSYGIELDSSLVATARGLASRFDSAAHFAHGSFIPDGYRWRPASGDARTGTLGVGESGYRQLGRPLDEFDVVFAYPWDGEATMMRDLMRQFGGRRALLLLHGATTGVVGYRDDRKLSPAEWLPGQRP